MKKIRDLRLLIAAAALATAGTSAGLAIAAATASVGVQADSVCEGAWLNGKTVVDRCVDPGPQFGALCVPASTTPPILAVLVCIAD